MWRGPALQDVGPQHSAAFDAAVVRLENLRLVATEERVDAEVALGRGADMVTELTDLVAAHPMREQLVAALMRALVAAGRGSEALLVYQRAREALADALGVDPPPNWRRCMWRCCGASWGRSRRAGRRTCGPS
ncbi:AfsR/SARP family transcriptional regulator [Yinghuangia aomiensis]